MASALVDHPVKTTARIESGGSGEGDWLVWWERTSTGGALYVDHPPYGARVRISRRGYAAGVTSDIEGGIVVYAEARARRGSHYRLMRYDLATGRRSLLRASAGWDYLDPTLSGDWLLYGAYQGSYSSVELWNVRSHARRVLARARGIAYVYPGQVAGGFAVWGTAGGSVVGIRRYAIATRRSTRLRGSGAEDSNPAVGADGTVYWVNGSRTCGHRVMIVRQPLTGAPTTLLRFREGIEGGRMNLADSHLFHSRVNCRGKADWDVYRVDVGPYDG